LHCAFSEFEKLKSGGFYKDCKIKETLERGWEKEAERLWEMRKRWWNAFCELK
jgi:hypothetical protein